MSRLAVPLMLLLAAPSAAALFPGASPWGAWIVETIAPQAASTDTFIRVERPVIHTAASRSHAGDAFYAYKDSSGWHSLNLGIGTVNGMDVDGDVIYLLMGGPKFNHAEVIRIENGVSSTEVVTALPNWLSSGELLVDSQSRVHVAMEDAGDTLHYATRDSQGTWQTKQIANDAIEVALALDSSDVPHILYNPYEDTNQLLYGTPDANGNWSFDTMTGCSGFPKLIFDSQDRPHVACGGTGSRLVYGWQDATGWHLEFVTFKQVRELALALDANDRPHVTFRYPFNSFNPDDVTQRSNLEYAVRTPAGWLFETADPDGTGNAFYSSIDIDDQGRPHVAYVIGWRSFNQGCSHPLNVCFDLRYATPAASALRLVGE